MHRRTRDNSDAPSHDSFLDIVANMVGILIILVMVVGVRVKNAPVVASIPNANREVDAELEKDLAVEQSLRNDVLEAAGQIRTLQNETLVQGRQRNALATMVSALEHEIRSCREQMDAESQRQFDLQRSLSDSRAYLEQLARQRVQAETVRPEPIVIESYPTPLSRTVDDRESHFQLRGGLIVPIPFDELIDRLKEEARQKTWKLRGQSELTETIGPVRGFRLRYTLQRHDISPEMTLELGYGGTVVRLERCSFIPVSSRMGEPVETALAEGSEFRRALASFPPGRGTITIWTYADSFASFRRLKQSLYRMGYTVAARPLPMDTPITASPQGSKSAEQ